VINYTPTEIYKELIAEKTGIPPNSDDQKHKRDEMKSFLKKTFQTD